VIALTCRDLILDLLADYVDDRLGPDVVAAVHRHLALCEPCRAYLATYRKTRELLAEPPELPEEVEVRMREVILERIRLRKT
jgi:anti-sigma factor RsiW